jgi:glutamate carboxypeptidase
LKFAVNLVFTGALLMTGAVPAHAELNSQLHASATAARDDVLKSLARLVNIDSGTGNETGVNQIGGIVAEELTKLGARIEFHSSLPAVGKNVVATLTGSGKAKILLIAHMDTVFADGSAASRPFRIDGKRAYGPGVADDKSGVVIGLYALKMLQQLKFSNFAQITLLLNTNEETGSDGTRALIEAEARAHDVALNLEPGRPADGLVVWRKGSAEIQIEVRGKSAHAGVAPDSGRNAAMEAAHQMLQLASLADPSRQTTVNFTVMKAGDRTNVIPDLATAIADVRATTPEEFDRVERDLARLSQKQLIPDTEVKAVFVRSFPPMPKNPRTDALADLSRSIYGELGLKLTLEGSGGAADSSLSAGVGTPTLDGFGIVGGNTHTAEEYIEVDSIVPRLYLLTRLLMELGNSRLQ